MHAQRSHHSCVSCLHERHTSFHPNGPLFCSKRGQLVPTCFLNNSLGDYLVTGHSWLLVTLPLLALWSVPAPRSPPQTILRAGSSRTLDGDAPTSDRGCSAAASVSPEPPEQGICFPRTGQRAAWEASSDDKRDEHLLLSACSPPRLSVPTSPER